MAIINLIEAAVSEVLKRVKGVDITHLVFPAQQYKPNVRSNEKLGGIICHLLLLIRLSSACKLPLTFMAMKATHVRIKIILVCVCIGTSRSSKVRIWSQVFIRHRLTRSLSMYYWSEAHVLAFIKKDFQAVDIESIAKPVTKWATTQYWASPRKCHARFFKSLSFDAFRASWPLYWLTYL